MSTIRKSAQAARELGRSYAQLRYLLLRPDFIPPQKDSSGDYVWTDADMARARKALRGIRRRKGVPA